MGIKRIVRAGDPILKNKANEVSVKDIPSEKIQSIIHDLIDTMKQHNGAGLAAPQVGIGLQILVYGFDSNPRYPGEGPIPLTTLINPKIIKYSDEQLIGFEGCLSLDTLRGEVKRAETIELSAYNEKGGHITRIISGFEARVIQHEVDHLMGTLIIERMPNFDKFGFTEELKAQNQIP